MWRILQYLPLLVQSPCCVCHLRDWDYHRIFCNNGSRSLSAGQALQSGWQGEKATISYQYLLILATHNIWQIIRHLTSFHVHFCYLTHLNRPVCIKFIILTVTWLPSNNRAYAQYRMRYDFMRLLWVFALVHMPIKVVIYPVPKLTTMRILQLGAHTVANNAEWPALFHIWTSSYLRFVVFIQHHIVE